MTEKLTWKAGDTLVIHAVARQSGTDDGNGIAGFDDARCMAVIPKPVAWFARDRFDWTGTTWTVVGAMDGNVYALHGANVENVAHFSPEEMAGVTKL
jgi:hypothetical protein